MDEIETGKVFAFMCCIKNSPFCGESINRTNTFVEFFRFSICHLKGNKGNHLNGKSSKKNF